MEEIRYYNIEGRIIPLVISDEEAALSRAKTQGRAVLGIMRGNAFLPALYVAESLADVDEVFAERVIRRQMGMPWVIAKTKRLLIREFQKDDWEKMEILDGDDFLDREQFEAYIQAQYPLFEYGLWAVVEKTSSRLVGRVGVWDGGEEGTENALELGYHIFSAYRRRGYAEEACRAVIDWCRKEPGTMGRELYTRIASDNRASICLAEKLGIKIARVQ